MTDLAAAHGALGQAKERHDAASRRLANTAGKSNSQIKALHAELKAAEIALAAAERQVALAGVTARIGFLATSHGRALGGRLYGLQ
jgi:hypothetical protein